ncbi:MAG: PepSY domain-containing protein [Defluviitaleaceae bacterium]|nr:PepSY domain-containing protein [Defluviitaleaceae bacterium]
MFNEEPTEMSHEIKDRTWLKRFVVALGVILVFGFAFMFWPASTSSDEATQIAISYVGGGVANTPERDLAGLTRVWSVEVFHNNLIHEVYVSMRTGEIVRVEVDR